MVRSLVLAAKAAAVGLTAADVRATFAETFEVVSVEEGKGRPSAWYTLLRR